MSAQSVTVKDAITSFSITGGTDQVFTPDGEKVDNGVHLIAAAVTDFYARPTITLRTRSAKVSAGAIVKAKRWYNVSQPRLDADGVLYYDVFRCEVETHPATAVADAQSFHNKCAHLMFTGDLTAFRSSGSLG